VSHYICSEGCDFRAPLTEVVYACTRCGGLLEVAQDVDQLKRTPGQAWRTLFDQRHGEARLPFASGVWSKREWIYPELEPEHVISLGEGRNPLRPLPRMAAGLGLGSIELKECGVSPTGSFKDLGMTVLVSAVARMRGQGVPVRGVACASTGDTSAAVSAYCAAAGIPSVVFLPRNKVSLAQLVQPLSNGALVLSIDTDFDGCMALVQEITRDRSLYLANSMNSLRLEGQKTVAIELVQQRGWKVPDWVVIPGGNLGNASALGMGFELMLALGVIERRPRIAVAQAQRANPLFRHFQKGFARFEPVSAQKTLASAIQIGNPVSLKRAVRALRAFDGAVEEASEAELANAAATADREGAFTCPQTGVALAALAKLVEKGTIDRGSEVVVIATAHGLKFADFKLGYHQGSLPDVPSARPNAPIEVPASLSAVQRALDQHLPTS
jgi:threonine synthase